MKWNGLAASLATLLLAVPACSETSPSSDVRSAGKFVATLRSTYSQDYAPVETPQQLAQVANLVLVGSLVDTRIGPSVKTAPDVKAGDEHGLLRSFVIDVAVNEVVAGDRSLISGGHAYIEIPRGDVTEDALDAALPGSRVLLFLEDLKDARRPFGVVSPGAGRPEAASHLAPLPQGFIFEQGNGSALGVEDLAAMPAAWGDYPTFDSLVDDVRQG